MSSVVVEYTIEAGWSLATTTGRVVARGGAGQGRRAGRALRDVTQTD